MRWIAAVAAIGMAATMPASAGAGTDVLRFDVDADTYVDESKPTASHGTSSSLWADASPVRQSFLRFWTPGLAGREVTAARVQLTQRDQSVSGGRVFSVPSVSWSERVTWEGRPALGTLQGTFGAVSDDQTYTMPIDPANIREGLMALGIDSTSPDGARWGSGESSTPPVLEVEVQSPDGFVADGLSLVAGPKLGSSEPTYHGTNRRLAVTAGGRLLTVHGRHSAGARLAWRDRSGGWSSRTTGAVTDGSLIPGTATGDWPASIAVTKDALGVEHGWVVWSGPNASALRRVEMRRISDLDDPAGPRVGPVVTVDAPSGGAYRADVAFERAAGGEVHGHVLWSRRTADSTYEIAAARFSPVAADVPSVGQAHVLYRTSSATRFGTLASTAGAIHAVARASGGRLTLYRHDAAAGWSKVTAGPYVSSRSAPSAVGLAGGEVLVAVERDTSNDVTDVVRFAPDGSVVTELSLAGYAQPTIAAAGDRVTVLAVAVATGHLVSRTRVDGAWSAEDRVEIGSEARSRVRYPNALREADGRLRLVAEGPNASANRAAVLAYQRPF